MSCWDNIPPKRSKAELELLGACHEGQGERRHYKKRPLSCTRDDMSTTIEELEKSRNRKQVLRKKKRKKKDKKWEY